jgi:acetyl esterase/lipase
VSVTGAPAGSGRVPAPAVAAGVTVGKSPPALGVGDGRKGSAAAEAATPAAVRGGMPPGSVAPRPDGIPPDPDVDAAFADAVAEIVALADAGAAAVSPFAAVAAAVRVACWPVLAVFGTVTAASSSSAWPAASVPTAQVAPLADGQTENFGVIAAVTLAVALTAMLVASPPDGQTQIAKLAVPPGCTEVATACTLTHSWTAGELAVGVGVGVLDGLGVGDGVGLALGLGELVVAEAVGLALAVVLAGGVLAAGVLAVAVAAAPVVLGVGVAAAVSCADETESSCISAALTVTEVSAAVAGCCPQVLVAAVVYACCVGCVPVRTAVTTPEVSIAPTNTARADVPPCRTLMMAPLSSWSSRRDLACRHASSRRLCASSIPSCTHSTPIPPAEGNRGACTGYRVEEHRVDAMDPAEILTRTAPPPDRTITYGPGPDNVADLRLPSGERPRGALSEISKPLVVVLHGGFWRAAYDRTHTGPMAAALAAEGYLVCVPEFRRVGQAEGGWPGTFADVAAAVDRLPGLVAAVAPGACDPGRLLLAGHSAGGHLALWAAGRHLLPRDAPWHAVADSRPRMAGVVALAPVSDLAACHRLGLDGGAADDLLGGGPGQVPQRYAVADPARFLPLGVSVRIVHGTADDRVPCEMSRSYAAWARSAGDDTLLTELPGGGHFDVIDPRSAAWPTVLAAFRSLAAR